MATSDARSITITIVQAVDLSFSRLSRRRANVQIVAGDVYRRTQTAETRKDKVARWDCKLDLPVTDHSSKIIIAVLHDSMLKDNCLGKIDIELEHLLELQQSQPNEDVILSLVDKKGNPSPARLYVRVTEDSISAVAGDAVEQAQKFAKKLTRPLVSNASDAFTNASDTLSRQEGLISSFEAVLIQLKPLVKIGDEISKIHPYVNFAWTVLSAGMKMVQAQHAQDLKILALVKAMEKTYSFIVSADELKNSPVLQDIIVQILKQTIECGYFIQEYTRHNFGERAIANPIADVDSQITKFCTAFADLRKDFDSRALLHVALVLRQTELVMSQMSSSVDAIRCKQVLKPEDMDQYNRTPCLKNTRRNVIKDIMEWIADDSNEAKKVLWVHGMAGTGKSTLSNTVAEIMNSLHRLGAFFFFNRDIPQRNFATLIRTLAYRLAMFDPRFGATISRVVADNDNIAELRLEIQFEKLLSANALKSVEWSGGPVVLIIDALDECGSQADRKTLMHVLSKGFSDLPSFIRIMVVSRQEPDIQQALGSHLHLRPYPLDIDSATNKDDVLEFIRHRLGEIRIKDGCLRDDWPGDNKINSLADGAGGLFVWASTACLYIESGYAPSRRLSELINKQPEGNSSSGPFAKLDSLYKTGLESAGLWDDPSFYSDCCNILGMILCARAPLSCSVIDALLALPEDTPSLKSVSRMRCVLHVSETERIRILHPSFHDYLSERCKDQPWSIDLERHNKALALRCVDLLDKELRENICDMTLPYMNRKITLPEAICYACEFWIEHICLGSDVTDDTLNGMYDFLVKHLLHWMEAMAILDLHDRTIRSIDDLLKWLRESSRSDTDLYRLLYDGHRFAQYFSNTIKVHPLLIYTTALAFTPTNTIIFKTFYHNGLPKVLCGVDKMWSPELIQLQGHEGSVKSVAFSPDGSKIISGSFDKTIRVWDASTGVEMLPPLRGHDYPIFSVAFSPDGTKIISGSSDMTIRVWDASTSVEIFPPLRGHDGWIRSVAFSRDGSKIVSGADDMTIRIWDASTGVEMLPPFRHDDRIDSVAFSLDGTKIIFGSSDMTIRVWDASTGVEMLPPLRGHDGWIRSVALSHDGTKIISGSDDHTIRIWNASTGVEMLPPFQDHDHRIDSAAFSLDGTKVIFGSSDMTIRVWDASTGVEVLPPLRGHNQAICSVAISPDGTKIISGSDDMTIRVWDASTDVEVLPPRQGHDDKIRSATFSPDGSKIISGSVDKTIRVWDASTGVEMLPPLRGHGSEIGSVAFSPDGSKIISGSDDMTIRVWDTSTGVEVLPPLRGHEYYICSVAFSPDGSKIISGSDDMTIRVWDANTGVEMLPPLRGHDHSVLSVAFSPDGSKIVSGSPDMTIRVWDASTGVEMLPPLTGHEYRIFSVAFSPDGSKIISRAHDTTIRVWDASTGSSIETLHPPLQNDNYFAVSVRFSPDGSKIISSYSDGSIRALDTGTDVVLPHAHVAVDDPRPAISELMIGGWIANINTGRYMGTLPVGVNFHSGHVFGSTYVGWTAAYELVLINFPAQ